MKKLVFFVVLLAASFASAEACNLNVTLLNQDPYPAVPGDYVKLVFQITGLENPECGSATLQLLEKYPIEFDEGEDGIKSFRKVRFIRDYSLDAMAAFKVRINPDALDGTNQIEARISGEGFAEQIVKFDLEVRDVKADFEVHVSSYDPTTHDISFQILNIAENDVKAVSIEIPNQDNIKVKGARKVIIGDLDSNEYSTADFKALARDGKIRLIISYSDSINRRRKIEKEIYFDSSSFAVQFPEDKKTPWTTYILVVLLIIAVIWFFVKRKKSHS
ncbi:hypothetical protein D6829_00825 [Candidatus Pacearchaeota archaeon]|nr:MAG: hypothetical protein D6829_00825 [Candidatus Pacearchaeota archaeon]